MIERHQLAATALFGLTGLLLVLRDGMSDVTLGKLIILAALLLPIWFYRLIAWLSSFGFPEYFAQDFGSRNLPGPYAFFFWLVFLIACATMIFDWSFF